MKNILIRSGMSPLDIFDPAHIMVNNSIGGNGGNLIYVYSDYRVLTTKNTAITPDYYRTIIQKLRQHHPLDLGTFPKR